MTRIPSGITDQGFYFLAYDSIDRTTLKTGLSSFTVYRSRNGAAEAAMTTPTVTEIDATNCPGLYFLLCDEDMTITSGNWEEEMAYVITASGMAPVYKVIDLFKDGDYPIEGSYSLNDFVRLVAAAAGAGKTSGMGTTTGVIRDVSDTKNRISATIDADGNRTAFGTLDAS